MDDNASKENPPAGFNKLDLTQLQGFSFGTQWTQDKSTPSDSRDHDDRPRRENRRDSHGAPSGAPPRDRRTFRKPVGAPGSADGGAPSGGVPAERQGYSGDRAPRRDGPGGGGDYRGGPRRDGGGDRGGQRYDRTAAPFDRGPYDSPYFAVTFYPEDTSFNTLVQTIRKSCRTIELFEIARTVVAKLDRFIVVLTRKTAPVAPGAEAPAKQSLFVSVPDGLPFETEEAAVSHVLNKHLGLFFDSAEAEIEPPKGNFQVINKCSITGELLGPPNYHRYATIVQQHHAAKVSRMSLEAYKGRIETIRDPEVVAQWLEKMKKTTRYTWKNPSSAKPAAAPAPAPAAAVASEASPETPADADAAAPAPEAAAAPAEAAPAPIAFDSFEDARSYLLTQARDKVVRSLESVRFHGTTCEQLVPGEIYNAVEGALERQRRFPLDTANALRGRLRREHFTIFKKGSKGVSYVCAVKRKFRVPGQTFADSIGALIGFIESHPMVRASELATKFLGIKLPAAPAAATSASITTPPVETPAAETPAAPEPVLTIEERAKIARLQGDLVWLVREGYVTEFIDGRLFAPPPMVEARKKEVEAEEHDPENFPDVPPETRPPMAVARDSAVPLPAESSSTPPVSEAVAAETPPAPAT
ncbi:MAG TPA: hypothetical protein VHO24_14850 [Opitutaceae bacterium]|nr:hypothetical protein [Opitutaceae bacterium]